MFSKIVGYKINILLYPSNEQPKNKIKETILKIKRYPNWKGRSKILTIWKETWYCIKIVLKTTKNLLKLINEFSKIIKYKINIQKFVVFLYNSQKDKKIIQFIIVSKIKILSNIFSQDVKRHVQRKL